MTFDTRTNYSEVVMGVARLSLLSQSNEGRRPGLQFSRGLSNVIIFMLGYMEMISSEEELLYADSEPARA